MKSVDTGCCFDCVYICALWIVVVAGKSADMAAAAVPTVVALNGDTRPLDGLGAGSSHVEV